MMKKRPLQDNTKFLIHFYTHNGWGRAAWCGWCRDNLLSTIERAFFRGESRL